MVAVQIRMALPQSSNEPGSGMSGKGAQYLFLRVSCTLWTETSSKYVMNCDDDTLYLSIFVNSRSTSCICLNLKVWASSHLDVAGIEAWHSLAQRLARTLQHHHWHLPTLAHPGITLKLFRSRHVRNVFDLCRSRVEWCIKEACAPGSRYGVVLCLSTCCGKIHDPDDSMVPWYLYMQCFRFSWWCWSSWWCGCELRQVREAKEELRNTVSSASAGYVRNPFEDLADLAQKKMQGTL